MPAPVHDKIGVHSTAGGSAYNYRLREAPEQLQVIIAPGCDTAEARRAVEQVFGAERVLDVRPIAPGRRETKPRRRETRKRQHTSTRHRWEKTGTHRYRCERCDIVKRNWIDPDTQQWFQTYQQPGAKPFRSDRVPACSTEDLKEPA